MTAHADTNIWSDAYPKYLRTRLPESVLSRLSFSIAPGSTFNQVYTGHESVQVKTFLIQGPVLCLS